MAANTVPIFPKTPKVSGGKIVTADTNYEIPTTAPVTVFSAGENGSRIDMIRICALGIESAGSPYINFFVYDGASAYYLVGSIGAPATPYNPVIVSDDTNYEAVPIIPFLPPGYRIVATTTETGTNGWMVTVFGGDY